MRRTSTRLSTLLAHGAAIAALATGLSVPQARAQTSQGGVPTRALEMAVESSTDAILLPSKPPGTLTFRNCAEPCKLRSLEVNEQSRFFVGGAQVTFADFAAFVRRSRAQLMTVFYQTGSTRVTRVVVIG